MIGSEEVPKKNYWTKCGHEFEKNSTATVTGFEIPDSNERIISGICAACPFPVEVTEGWGENKKHVRWECRAGSQPPNHKTEWAGNLDDKNTIQINSLDYNLLEEIREYCEAHPDLGAGYNTDHLADCRRTLSVCCSPNKKGITAKHELIEKFFQDDRITQVRNLLSTLIGKEIRTHYNTGGIVTNVIGPHNAYGPGSWTINYTKDGKKRKNPCIINSIKVENGIITCDGKPLQIIEPKKDGETCEESLTNTGSDICVSGTPEDTATSTVDKPTVMTAQDSNDTKIQTCATCQANKEDCQPYQACTSEGLDPEECVCNNWSGKAEGNEMIDNTRKTAENDDFLPENVTKNDEIVTFDYSTVDADTGAFLQEKAARIMEIRFKSVVAIGKELREAQDKLANNKIGVFQQWINSIGITPRTAYNYINGYEYIVKNFHNIEDAESIQPSLLFAVSKPSARPELQQAVLSGDITTHKQYKELEEQLRKKEQELASAKEYADKQAKYADEHMMRARTAEFELEKNKKSYESLQIELRRVQQQFEQAKRNSDPSKIQELGQIISEKQREIEDLRQQLRDKPIETTATRVVEKLPDDVQEYLSSVDTTIHHMQNYAKVNQVLNLVVGLSTEEMQSWAMMMNNRKAVRDDEEAETLELLAMAIQSLQDMMDDYESRRCE